MVKAGELGRGNPSPATAAGLRAPRPDSACSAPTSVARSLGRDGHFDVAAMSRISTALRASSNGLMRYSWWFPP